jgi:DNA-binding MarR family transcriptional regulator
VSKLILSARRKQFLQKLLDLYKKTNVPVHYETLAKSLGVSKWTSYDMMKELEKLGYLIRDYIVNPGEAGRSQIVFRPTDKTSSLFEQDRSESAPIHPEEWQQIKSKVLAFLGSFKSVNLSDAMQKMLEEVPKVQVRVSFCAHTIGLFLVYLRKLGGRTESLIKNLVQNAPNHEMKTTMFVGTVLGTIMQTMNHEIGAETANLVKRYQQWFHDLTDQERGLLSDFLTEALA